MKKLIVFTSILFICFSGMSQVNILNESELEEFKYLALKKATTFSTYITKIANKSTSYYDKETAISQSLNLFIHDTVTIQVSYCGGSGNNKIIARQLIDYLRRLSLLNYDQVQIEWVECAMIKDLTKGDDGNYYGIISFVQKFSGLRGETKYMDVTTKNIEIVLKPYQKPNDKGESEWRWEVFLSDVNVKEPCS